MSYGIVARNENGEDIFGGPLFWLREKGVTSVFQMSDTVVAGDVIIPSNAGYDISNAGHAHRFKWETLARANDTRDHYIADGFEDLGAFPQNQYGRVPGAAFSAGELAFFRLTSNGFFAAEQVFNRFPEFTQGQFLHVAAWQETAPLPYYICSTTPGSPAGSYGLQVFDENGDIEFDSRQETPRIVDHFYVPSADARSVLFDNAVIDIPLTVPTATPMVSVPLWFHGLADVNGDAARVRMRLLNNSTIRLSRVMDAGFSFAHLDAVYVHDAFLTVAL